MAALRSATSKQIEMQLCYIRRRDELYYELRIQNPDDHDDYEQLIILIVRNEHTRVMSVLESDSIKAVVNDTRTE